MSSSDEEPPAPLSAAPVDSVRVESKQRDDDDEPEIPPEPTADAVAAATGADSAKATSSSSSTTTTSSRHNSGTSPRRSKSKSSSRSSSRSSSKQRASAASAGRAADSSAAASASASASTSTYKAKQDATEYEPSEWAAGDDDADDAWEVDETDATYGYALAAFKAPTEEDGLDLIDFARGDKLKLYERSESGWWRADLHHKRGHVVTGYVSVYYIDPWRYEADYNVRLPQCDDLDADELAKRRADQPAPASPRMITLVSSPNKRSAAVSSSSSSGAASSAAASSSAGSAGASSSAAAASPATANNNAGGGKKFCLLL